jgi:hypothetical protein
MIRVMASSVVNAPIQGIWALLGDFSTINQWLPGIASCVLDEGGTVKGIGSTRRLTFADGGKMREELLGLSEQDTSITFAIIESELPIANYVSTIRLQPVTDGDRSYISWTGEFEVTGDQHEQMALRMKHDIYQPAFDALKKRFEAA